MPRLQHDHLDLGASPPVYKILNDGRVEHNLFYVWQVPIDWSVNLPMVALRLLTVVLVTTGWFLACSANKPKEAK